MSRAEWISEAIEAGIQAAEAEAVRRTQQIAAAKVNLEAEEVTPEQLEHYLEPYKEPLLGIVAELTEAGFIVEEVGPDLLSDSHTTSFEQRVAYIARYSLAEGRRDPHTDSGDPENFVFGVGWEIGKEVEDPRGRTQHMFGRIHLYPVVDPTTGTRLGGVEYSARGIGDQITGGSRTVVSNLRELGPVGGRPSVETLMKQTIGVWIRAFEVKQRAGQTAAPAQLA